MTAYIFAAKLILAAAVIGYASWLSDKKPVLAGFIVALPLVSILALLFSYIEHKDPQASITFAKSIMIGVPVSWLFFLPFFFADKYGYGFWMSFGVGILLLILGFVIHSYITSQL